MFQSLRMGVIVISGGTKGIGLATVKRFALQGWDVVFSARTAKDVNNLVQELSQKYPNQKIYGFVCDMSKKNEVLLLIDKILALYSHIDALVNNTGVFIPGQIQSEDDGVLEHQINTNLYSAYHLTRGLVPSMMKQKHGSIYNICSTASITPYINGGSYCISKYALLGFSKVLREEMKEHNIRVTSILPGATFTASWEGVEVDEDRLMPAEDVASAIWNAYQCSDRTVIEEIILRPQLGDL